MLIFFIFAVTGPDLDEATSNLMALGYEQDQVIRALNASFNNPDRAAELLMTVSVACLLGLVDTHV